MNTEFIKSFQVTYGILRTPIPVVNRGKWTLLILRDLMFNEKCSFLEFKASAEKISSAKYNPDGGKKEWLDRIRRSKKKMITELQEELRNKRAAGQTKSD